MTDSFPFLHHNAPPIISEIHSNIVKSDGGRPDGDYSGSKREGEVHIPARFSNDKDIELLALQYSKLISMFAELSEDVGLLRHELQNVEKAFLKSEQERGGMKMPERFAECMHCRKKFPQLKIFKDFQGMDACDGCVRREEAQMIEFTYNHKFEGMFDD